MIFEFENYCDDSGTDGNSQIAVAACYVSSKSQWEEFARNWNRVREDEGFDVFHMVEFVAKPKAGHKPFCDWGNVKKERVYAKLASIINTRTRCGFGVAIPKDPFDRAAPQHFLNNYAKDHYTYAVHCCLGLLAAWREQYKITPPIRYVFDQGSPEEQIRAVWKLLASDPHYAARYGLAPEGCTFEDKKLFKPLQAADILAWQMRNHMRRVILAGKDDVADCHPGFRALRQNRPMRLGFYSEAQMLKVFADLEDYEQIHGKPASPSLFIPRLV